MDPRKISQWWPATVATLSVLGLLVGSSYALKSSLFRVRAIDVQVGDPSSSPLSAQQISAMTRVKIDQDNLFALDMQKVEARLRASPWVTDVIVQKRFPYTLGVFLKFRKAAAIWQTERGALVYIDEFGQEITRVGFEQTLDMPVLQGFKGQNQTETLRQAIDMVYLIQEATQGRVDSLSYSEQNGFRAILSQKELKFSIFLGSPSQEQGEGLPAQLDRVAKVLTYLKSHSIAPRQIRADVGKKIVVKTARGS